MRELENCIQRALVLGRGETIEAYHLNLDDDTAPWSRELSENLSYEDGKRKVLEAYQRRAVERALRETRGNVTQAAQICNLTRAAFQRILRQLDLDRHRFDRRR